MCEQDCHNLKNELKLHKLCAHQARIDCLDVESFSTDKFCSDEINAVKLNAQDEVVNNLCVAVGLKAAKVETLSLNSNTLCSQSGTINTLCVDNLTVGNFAPVEKYRATVNYSADFTYTLGSFLNFNNIVDDPNGSISLSPNTSYTAPISGYYMMTFKVNVTNVSPTNGPILGVPVANPEVYVNGILVREGFSPFLTFFNDQKVILNSLITLQQGDVVTMKYNIFGANGVAVVGTVDIVGAGIEDGNSLFKIILLTALGSGGSQPTCMVCPPVSIPCAPITVDCDRDPQVMAGSRMGRACSSCK